MAKKCAKWDELIGEMPAKGLSSYGKCVAVAYKDERRSSFHLAEEKIYLYKTGFIDGLSAYIINKNKEQFVGNGGVTLNEALLNLEQIWNFNPRTER